MGYSERKVIIEKIEKIRKSKVITYFITTRPFLNTGMDTRDLREFYKHLAQFRDKKAEKIDLIIYSPGGDTVVGWALVNLIREFSEKFGVIVPYYAFSCATVVAIGADEIVMGRMASLGPIDPQVINPFNPENKQNQLIPISVEDIGGFISLLRDKFEMRNEELLAKLSERLATDVRPLALGNAYRLYIKAREDARKLLELHMDAIHEKPKIDKIIETLVEKLYYHLHHINRKEAKEIGLKVHQAEEFKEGSENLENLMWELYLDYEKELHIFDPYKDELPSTGNVREISIKFIESISSSSQNILQQYWREMEFPEGSYLSSVSGVLGVYIPPHFITSTNTGTGGYAAIVGQQQQQGLITAQVIPIQFNGQAVYINKKIYDKKEYVIWR
ncbi:MAG: hypothetical protein NTV10_00100 [Methanoregula sp.]|nr:hypothetical protein [Methanoregula sp.]